MLELEKLTAEESVSHINLDPGLWKILSQPTGEI